jgi:hypothetical protein
MFTNINDEKICHLFEECTKVTSDNPESYVYSLCNDQYDYDSDYFDRSCKWLVILQKLDSTRTNENRKNLFDHNYAEYRADKLKVIKIIDINNPSNTRNIITNEREIVHVMCDKIQTLYNCEIEYEVNNVVESKFVLSNYDDCDNYDNCDNCDDCGYNKNKSCRTAGIKFFKTLIATYVSRDMPHDYTGYWASFRNDGFKYYDGHYLHGKKTDDWKSYDYPISDLTRDQTRGQKFYVNDSTKGRYIMCEGDVIYVEYSI